MEKKFEIINLSAREKGLLKTVGVREVVVSLKLLPGADNLDNDWLMQAVKNVYMQYYSRVEEYRKMEEK